MAVMAAMGCSLAAIPAAATVIVTHSISVIREGGLSLGLPQKRCKRGLGWVNSSFSCKSTNMGQISSRSQIKAATKLGDVGMDMLPATEANEVKMPEDSNGLFGKVFLTGAIALMPLVDVEAASAVEGEFGILEGRSIALLHPIAMGSLFVFTIYAGYLGWQWRRVRTIQDEINALKKEVKQVPVAAGDKSAPPPPPSPVEAKISALTEERKELLKGGFRDRHYNAGSILLGLGVFESVGGAVNTWFRTGKLFPGPHLFAGAGITICWALAASLVPAMQKGNETARNLHIALNVINLTLFVWQIPTGWEIVEKVFQFTTWP